MQVIRQYVDQSLTVGPTYHQREERSAVGRLDSPTSRIAQASKVDCIIDATRRGESYVPTKAQRLAAELAEELYGAQVTFVQADPSSFRELVQSLTGPDTPSSSVANVDQVQSLRVPPSLSSDTETSSDSDDQSRRSGYHLDRSGYASTVSGRQAGEEEQQIYSQPAFSPRARSSDIEHSSSCSTSGSGRLQPTSGLGPRRNSTFKQERRQPTKKMEQLGISFNILTTRDGFASSSSTSPVTPFALRVCETLESSSTPTGQGNFSSFSNSLVSPTTMVFPLGHRTPVHRGEAQDPEDDRHMTALRLERDFPYSPYNQDTRQMWQPQLLSLFPESPSQHSLNLSLRFT